MLPPAAAQVSRLRSQLRALVDKAAGAAGAASVELQALLRDSQAEAEGLRGEVLALGGRLQVRGGEGLWDVEVGRADDGGCGQGGHSCR